ncbi:MAG: hypothetical protein ACI4C1_06520 [Lachnospiraceae bacterium]
MDFKRSCLSLRFLGIVLAILFLLIAGEWPALSLRLQNDRSQIHSSIYDLWNFLQMDTFKVVVLFLLSGLYTNSFCKDSNSRYLRLILTRTDITTYTQSRFFANFFCIVLACLFAFYLFLVVTSPVAMISKNSEQDVGVFYQDIVLTAPLLYVAMLALQFAVVATACSSVGLLASSYQANNFVSIGLPGFIFFLALSYIPLTSIFSIKSVVGMDPTFTKSYDSPWQIDYAWGILYPTIVTVICACLFYRRMKWRIDNGRI